MIIYDWASSKEQIENEVKEFNKLPKLLKYNTKKPYCCGLLNNELKNIDIINKSNVYHYILRTNNDIKEDFGFSTHMLEKNNTCYYYGLNLKNGWLWPL